jgi:transposase
MGRPFDDDLRRKFLSAYDAGEATLEELAGRFLVSVGWAKKISAQRNRSGQAERVRHQPGRKPRAGVEAQRQVVAWVDSQPDLTLAELQARLKDEAGVSLGLTRIWHLVRKLKLRLKKVAPRHRTRHRRKPQAAQRVHRARSNDLAGTADISGREWCHYLDDAPPCTLCGRHSHP